MGAPADVRVPGWSTGAEGTSLVVEDDGGRHWICSPLVGRVHVGNIAAAWAAGRSLGIAPDTIAAGLAATAAPVGRNTLLREPGGPLVVVDYAHTPGALAAAVQTARDLADPGGRVHLVLGADTGDVVLVVGHGHEATPTHDGPPVHFDDAEVAQEALESRADELETEQAC